MLSDEIRAVILGREDLGAKVKGERLYFRCPRHDDHNPSAWTGGGAWGCFSCGFEESIVTLAADLGVELNGAEKSDRSEIVAEYDYHSEDGETLFQVVRFAPKRFAQRRPDGSGGWTWNLNGVRRVPYRLPALVDAVERQDLVFIVEGEKDVHALMEHRATATTCPGGAGKWNESYNEFFRGADVVIVADKDEPGYAHARAVQQNLTGVARNVTVVEAAEGKDAADHLAAGRGVHEFVPARDSTRAEIPIQRFDLFDPYTSVQARADTLIAGDGISTGITSLDAAGFHLRAGNVWTLAARQGGGKTSSLLEILMRHVETEHDACALFISFEGSRYELYMRLLLRQVALARVEDGREPGAPFLADAARWLKTGRVFERETKHHTLATEWEAELEASARVLDGHLEAHRLVIIDGDDVPTENGHGGVTASRIMDALRLAPRRPTLAVFDYWQKLTPANRADARVMQLAETADRLRRYAKGDGDPSQSVVVLTAAQVNRGATGQPGLEHIRESDDLGNDGAGVVTLYLPDTADSVKKMRLQVVKNRFGPCGGRAELLFYGNCGYFAETDTEAERQARTNKTRERIRADVERLHAENPAATNREARAAVRGNNGVIDEAYRDVFGVVG